MISVEERANMTFGEAGVIKIFVRKGYREEQRTLSFCPSDNMDQIDLIESGYAIDGNRAIRYVNLDVESLLDAQRELIAYIQSYGYQAHFI